MADGRQHAVSSRPAHERLATGIFLGAGPSPTKANRFLVSHAERSACALYAGRKPCVFTICFSSGRQASGLRGTVIARLD
jgi:hypothetical protein